MSYTYLENINRIGVRSGNRIVVKENKKSLYYELGDVGYGALGWILVDVSDHDLKREDDFLKSCTHIYQVEK